MYQLTNNRKVINYSYNDRILLNEVVPISDFDFTSYTHMVDFLGGCFDNNTEIVLYSLDNIKSSIIAVHNGHISGKKIGDSLSSFAISKLKDKGKEGPPYYLNHISLSKDKTPLRSNTFFILDKAGKPRGVITISTDVAKYQKAADLLLALASMPNMENGNSNAIDLERLQSTPKDLIMDIIYDVTSKKEIEPSRLLPEEKLEVVRRLNNENFFLMKGAVNQIATILDSSEATIYRYLSKVNKRNGSDEL